MDRINSYCFERLEDSDKEYSKPIKDKSIADIADLATRDGFIRLEDYVKYTNEQSINRIKNFEKYDSSYAMNVAIEMSKVEAREELIEYIKEKVHDMVEEKNAAKEGK